MGRLKFEFKNQSSKLPKPLAQIEVELFLILPFLARLKKRERIAGISSKKNNHDHQIITKKKELLDHVFTLVAKAPFSN